jgi:AraC-like DNA-binding protein
MLALRRCAALVVAREPLGGVAEVVPQHQLLPCHEGQGEPEDEADAAKRAHAAMLPRCSIVLTMRYAEYPPPLALRGVLHCLWRFEDERPAGEPQRIVPDGRSELVVHLGDPYREVESGAVQPRALFAGQLTRPLWLEANGRCDVIGVRFRPAGARVFIGGSMRETTDRRVALADGVPGTLEGLAAWIGEEVARRAVPDDAHVRAAVEHIEHTGGEMQVAEMVEASGLGRRTLERRFLDYVGISPALLANVFRFRRVFDAIEHDSARPWTDAAAAAGYFDQSHLIRDFRRFVGCTPTEFAASRPGLATALVE